MEKSKIKFSNLMTARLGFEPSGFTANLFQMAEEVRFELTVTLLLRRFSRPLP
jgi:hypothetical protein